MSGLIIGYGNPDRQDDGVAWHILAGILSAYGLAAPESIDIDEFVDNNRIHLLFQLQLLPELADVFDHYDFVIFIDAHTGSISNGIEIEEIQPDLQPSPLTHHLTPNRLLFIAQQLHGKFPRAILVSVKGYEFQFSQELSPQTAKLVSQAISTIQDWVKVTLND
jgi:hydrogenase maturation protease